MIKGDSKLFTRRVNALHSMGYLQRYEIPIKNGRLFMLVHSKFAQFHGGFNPNDLAPCEISNLRATIMNLIQQSKGGICHLSHLWNDVALPDSLTSKALFISVLRQLSKQGHVELCILASNQPKRRYYCVKYLTPLPHNDDCEMDYVEERLDTIFNDFEEEGRPKFPPEIDIKPSDFHSLIPCGFMLPRKRVLFNLYYPIETQLCHIISAAGTTGALDSDISVVLTGTTYDQPNTRILELITSNNSRPGKSSKTLDTYLKSSLGYLAIIRGVDYVEFKRNFRYFVNSYYSQITKTGKEPDWGTYHLVPSDNTLTWMERTFFIRIPGLASISVRRNGTMELIFFGDSQRARGSEVLRAEKIPEYAVGRKELMRKVAARDRVSSLRTNLDKKTKATSKAVKSVKPSSSTPNTVSEAPPEVLSTETPELPATSIDPPVKTEPGFVTPRLNKRKGLDEAERVRQKRRIAEPEPSEVVIEISSSSRDTTPFADDSRVRRQKRPLSQNSATDAVVSVEIKTEEDEPTPAENEFPSQETSIPFYEPRTDAALEKMKQNLRVLEIIQGNGGVMSSQDTLNSLNEKYAEVDNKSTGKRGFGKIVRRLEKYNYVRQVYVVVPFADLDTHVTRSILVHKSVDDDDSRITDVKNAIVKEVRRESEEKAKKRANDLKEYTQRAESSKMRQFLHKQTADAKKARREREKKDRREAREREAEAKRRTKLARSRTKGSTKQSGTSTLRINLQNTRDTSDIFFRVVVITRSLFGGFLNTINWDRVAAVFVGHSTNDLKLLWRRVQKQFGWPNIDQVMKAWEKTFLQAYEAGVIPIVRNGQYDLLELARFWMRRNPEARGFSAPLLYDTRAENEKQFIFTAEKIKSDHDVLFSAISHHSLESKMGNWVPAFAKHGKPDTTAPQITLAKTAIRSIIATSPRNYTAARGKDVLQKFGEETCVAAIEELEKERAVVYIPRNREAVRPERNFGFSEMVKLTFKPRLGFDAFAEMTEFYQLLLSTLNASKGFVMSPMAPDYSLVCVLDLVCHAKVDLVRVRNEVVRGSNSATMLDDGDNCSVVVRTPVRTIGASEPHVMAEIRRSTKRSVPTGEPGTAVWTDVRGKPNRAIWHQLVYWLLFNLDARPGQTVDGVWSQVGYMLSRAEVAQLVRWLVKKNIVRKGPEGGYWVLPEWYAKVPF